MAQVKGTLWFGTDITDDALKKAQQLRKQIEQQFAKDINLKMNIQGLDTVKQQSKQVQVQLSNMASALSSQNVNLSGLRALKAQLFDVQRELKLAAKDLKWWEREYKRTMRVGDMKGAELSQTMMNSLRGRVSQFTTQYNTLTRQLQMAKLAEEEMRKQSAQTARVHREQAEEIKKRTKLYANLNSNMRSTIGISGELTGSMAGLFSVYKAKELLSHVIQIGGQLEQQRVSIGAILHDTAHADDLFGRIKNLALQSPFGVLDLDKYTKQLSAYGFQYNELFDMTKRLADISAGAGTDISRLALALGHVKSATYLTGITLRQFSMNNIPMLKMLADYYTELEGRIVSTAEVQKRISSREVGYEAVIEVIKRMTDEGGQFYNMQAVMADTLAGKWKNLKDAIDLMYGSIGESFVGDALKEVATILTSATKNWKSLAMAVMAAAGVYSTYRIQAMATNRVLGSENIAIQNNYLAWKRAEAQKLLVAKNYRQLTAAEQMFVNTSRVMTTANLRELVSSKELSKEYVLRSIALGQIKAGQAGHLVGLQGITKAEIKAALAMSNTNKVMLRLKLGFAGLAASMKALLFNPWTLAFAGITAGLEVINHYMQQSEKSAERTRHALDTATEGYKNLADEANKYKPGIGTSMSEDALRQAVDSMIGTIKDYSSQAQNLIRNALYVNPNEKDNEKLQMRSLSEQYNILAQSLLDVKDAYELMRNASNVFENANKGTGGTFFWDDSFDKNVKDYLSDMDKVANAETRFLRDRVAVNNALEKTGIFPNASSADLETVKNYVHNLDLVSVEWSKLKEYAEDIDIGDWAANINILDKAKKDFASSEGELKRDLSNFATTALKDLENSFGKTADKWGQSERLAAQQLLSLHIHSIENMTDEGARKIESMVYDVWNNSNTYLQTHPLTVDADVDRAMKNISEMQQYLEKMVGRDWIVKLNLQTVGSFEEYYDQLDKNVKDGRETMRKIGDALSKQERDFATSLASDVSLMSKEQLEYRNAYFKYQNSIDAANKEGFKLSSLEDKKNKKNGAGAKVDEFAKQMSERVQLLKKAQAEYKKWLNIESSSDAFKRVKDSGIFASLFGDGKIKSLDDISNILKDYRSKLNPQKAEQKKVIATIDEMLLGMEYDDAEKRVDATIELLRSAMSKVASQWDNYKELFDKTGDKAFSQLAFSNGIMWDDKTRAMADTLKQSANLGSISYDMSEEEAKEFFNYNDKRGKELFNQWKTISDAIKENYIKALKESADAQSSIMTNAQKIEQLEAKIAKWQSDGSGIDHSAQIQQTREEIERLKSELFETLPVYEKIFGDRTYRGYKALKDAERVARELIGNAKSGPVNPKTGRASYYTSFYLGSDGIKKVTLTRDQLERLKRTVDDFHKDETKKNPFATLAEDLKILWLVLSEKRSSPEKKEAAIRKFGESVSATAEIVGGFAKQLSSMFDALGNEGLADAMDDVAAAMDSVNNIAKGFENGGVVGGIVSVASEAVSWIGRIAQKHDKKLDKAIQKSTRRVKELQNAYKNLETEIDRALGGIYTAGGYDEMFKNYKEQLAELQKQRKAENDKKKKDQDKLLDYDQQITEMKNTIKYFAQDMAKELYNIDVKSWAKELTDAVVDAWAKGEDAAQAWHDKVRDLVTDITKNILAQKVVENALKPVLNYVTEQMTAKNGKLDENDVVQIARRLDEAGQSSVNTITSLLDAMKMAGLDITESESKSGNLSSSINSITEDAGDLLVSYVNAIRADVSVTRFDMDRIAMHVESQIPAIGQNLAEQTTILRSIESNTGRNADSNDEILSVLRGWIVSGIYTPKIK